MALSFDLVLRNPRNAAPRRFLAALKSTLPAVMAPDDVPDPYYGLGTHPDLVARLWDELGGALPVDCRCVFHGTPALVRPDTGTVFGFATGTHTYALRLPPREREAAMGRARGRTQVPPPLNLDQLGPEWVVCGWFPDEEAWCRAAWVFAGP